MRGRQRLVLRVRIKGFIIGLFPLGILAATYRCRRSGQLCRSLVVVDQVIRSPAVIMDLILFLGFSELQVIQTKVMLGTYNH